MRIARVHIHDTGMRIVEMDLEHRITQWAERRGVIVDVQRAGDHVELTFARASDQTLFALEFPRVW